MSIPQLPWYRKLRDIVAPTEHAAELFLVLIILITIVVIIKGGPVAKAAWAVYLISP